MIPVVGELLCGAFFQLERLIGVVGIKDHDFRDRPRWLLGLDNLFNNRVLRHNRRVLNPCFLAIFGTKLYFRQNIGRSRR